MQTFYYTLQLISKSKTGKQFLLQQLQQKKNDPNYSDFPLSAIFKAQLYKFKMYHFIPEIKLGNSHHKDRAQRTGSIKPK